MHVGAVLCAQSSLVKVYTDRLIPKITRSCEAVIREAKRKSTRVLGENILDRIRNVNLLVVVPFMKTGRRLFLFSFLSFFH